MEGLTAVILVQIFPARQRGLAIGLRSIGWAVGELVFYTVGGYLFEYFSWRLLFFLGIPSGIASAVLGLPVGLLAANFLPLVGEVAARHPGLRLLIDHLGRAGGAKDAAAFANLPELLALAKYPNVAVKASGAPSYSSKPYPSGAQSL